MSVKLTEIIFLPWDLLVVENRTLEQLSRRFPDYPGWYGDETSCRMPKSWAGLEVKLEEYVSFDATE